MALNPHRRQSHQILGAGIILTGALILAIGLIIGLEFPRYIRDRFRSRACVTSTVSHDYRDWLHNRNRSKYNVLRIWNLTNAKEFIMEGHAPQFKLTGPYIFEETEVKKDVSFNGAHVTYLVSRTQTFDLERTAKECPNCSPYDKVTILNPAFLQKAGIHSQEVNFYRMLVSTVLSDSYPQSDFQKSSTMPLQSDHQFSDPQRRRRPWTTAELDFHGWLRRDQPYLYRRIVAKTNVTSPMAPSAFLRVYEHLVDSKIYGDDVFLRPSLWNACLRHFSNTLNAVVRPPQGAARSLDSPIDSPAVNASAIDTAFQQSESPPSCGLFFYLSQLLRTSSFSYWWIFQSVLSSHLCEVGVSVPLSSDITLCFLLRAVSVNGNRQTPTMGSELLNDDVNRTGDYLEALARYAVDYLPNLFRNRVPLTPYNLWDKMTVREAATGYYADLVTLERLNDVTFDRRANSSIVRIKGFLDHDVLNLTEDYSETQHDERGYHSVTLRTCLYNRSQQNNLNYEAIDGLHSDSEVTSDGHPGTLLVHGQQDFKVRSASKLTPCRSPPPVVPYVILYSPETWRPANFVFTGSSNYRWVELHDYRLQLDNSDELCRFSTSGATGYASWVSPFPIPETSVIMDNASISNKTNTKQRNWISANNRVLIEPVSGQVWRTETNLNYLVGFRWAPGKENASYVGVPVTSHHISSYTEPAERVVALYKDQIYSLLQASCTGIISLSIAGALVVLIGLGVAFSLIHRPPYRVGPQLVEPSVQLPYDGINVVMDRESDGPEMLDSNIYF